MIEEQIKQSKTLTTFVFKLAGTKFLIPRYPVGRSDGEIMWMLHGRSLDSPVVTQFGQQNT
jgi:hypothetical protein